jgi:agmatine deiminase
MRHNEIITDNRQTPKRLPAEFEEQSFVQMIFPHEKSDWIEYLEEARKTFVTIIKAIAKFEKCLVVCDNIQKVCSYFQDTANIKFAKYETNDTWARDCSAISIVNNGEKQLLDFTFTGWGGKFDATKDDAMSSALAPNYAVTMEKIDFILEGGAIESNGAGLLLTTSECMLNPNRNTAFSKEQTTSFLKDAFALSDVLYLDNGYLAGDDTDSHIDTLARFVDKDTIMYVTCKDILDEHFDALQKMELQLQTFAKHYDLNLIPLPFCDPLYYEDERLPATYANFLIINAAVLVPTYGVKQDQEALAIFRDFFKDREVIGIDCSVLVRQHGSLHCVTMQFL